MGRRTASPLVFDFMANCKELHGLHPVDKGRCLVGIYMTRFDRFIGAVLLVGYSGLFYMFAFTGGYIHGYWGWF